MALRSCGRCCATTPWTRTAQYRNPNVYRAPKIKLLLRAADTTTGTGHVITNTNTDPRWVSYVREGLFYTYVFRTAPGHLYSRKDQPVFLITGVGPL